MDPYNNNPFITDSDREPRSEYAANRAMRKGAGFPSETDVDFDPRNYTDGAWWLEREAERNQ